MKGLQHMPIQTYPEALLLRVVKIFIFLIHGAVLRPQGLPAGYIPTA
jgi:hypothetical protein